MNIDSLVIISSEGCNLNCSYCMVTKPQQQINNEIIKESFKNGTFFNNIQKTFEELSQNPNKINSLSLWGQEPTLTLREFSDIVPDLFHFFPNLSRLHFSTNGVALIENIVYLIKILSKQNFQKQFKLDIQISHDGTYSTEKMRKVSSQTIINNIKNFIKMVNTLEINPKLLISIGFHGVLSRDIMKTFMDNEEGLLNYWLEWDKYLQEFNEINLSSNLIIKCWTPGMETPINASKEEGEMYINFFKKSKEVFQKNNIHSTIYESMLGMYTRNLVNSIYANYNYHFEPLIYKMSKYWIYDSEEIRDLSSQLFCGPFTHALKIRYDGTLIHCQNVVHLLESKNCENIDEQEFWIAKSMLKHNYYPNIARDGFNEQTRKIFDKLTLFEKSGYPQVYTLVVNLMKILLEANQIDASYKNNEKLLRHAFMVSWINICIDNETRINGSAVTKTIGFIRLLCNGFLDVFEDFLYNTKEFDRYKKEVGIPNYGKNSIGEKNGI